VAFQTLFKGFNQRRVYHLGHTNAGCGTGNGFQEAPSGNS
jgi:hypothetical protein